MIQELEKEFDGNSDIDFWRNPTFIDKPVDIKIPRLFYDIYFKPWLQINHLINQHSIIISNVEELIAEREEENNHRLFLPIFGNNSDNFYYSDADGFFDAFPNFDEVINLIIILVLLTHAQMFEFMKTIKETPKAKALDFQISSIGNSYEGRPLRFVTFSAQPQKMARKMAPKKPLIWLDCNIHAREWITAPVCLYIMMMVS